MQRREEERPRRRRAREGLLDAAREFMQIVSRTTLTRSVRICR
jgi:hypothetical protein